MRNSVTSADACKLERIQRKFLSLCYHRVTLSTYHFVITVSLYQLITLLSPYHFVITISLCYHCFFSHLNYSYNTVLKHLKLHTLVPRRKYLNAFFLINIFNGSKYCPTSLKTVYLRVPHSNFNDFSLFNVNAKSYNCPSTRCVSSTLVLL